MEVLRAGSAAGLKEATAKLPKEVKEYAEMLISLMQEGKGKRSVEKSVEKAEKAEKAEKKGKKGKGKNEEVEEKPVVTSFLEGLKLVTDFGGPLFKSYDRGENGG